MKARIIGFYLIISSIGFSLSALANECDEAMKREDWSMAITKCTKLAEEGNTQAQLNLGISYIRINDVQNGIKWIRKSAANGNTGAEYTLGKCYAYGYGVEKNVSKALNLFVKLLKMGVKNGLKDITSMAEDNVIAQNTLAGLYETGDGVPKNISLAVKWYRMAAESGNTEALNSIQKMAENNVAVAQYNLAEMYQQGLGVPENRLLALKWSRKSFENGFDNAKDFYAKLAIEDLIYAGDTRDIQVLIKDIDLKCKDLNCAFDMVWAYIDKTGDQKLSLAELARFQRNIVKFSFTVDKKEAVDIGEMVAVNLGSILLLPITASSIVHSFDYNNDGVLSKNEVISDSDFALMVGINAKQAQKGVNFKKIGDDAREIMKFLPLLGEPKKNIRVMDAAALADIKNAFTASQAFFSDYPTGTVDLSKLLKYGLRPSKDVEIQVLAGKVENLKIRSKHTGGSKVYVIDADGTISTLN